MLSTIADGVARLVGRLRPRPRLPRSSQPLKLNVGSGLGVAPGWIHIDGNIHVLMAGAPRAVLSALHRRAANVRQWLPRDEYVRRLRSHTFMHYDLARGLPLPSNTVSYVYCSHVLEHFYADDARRLVAEMYRVLQPGGIARLCVPDLEHAVRLYQQGDRHGALQYFFTPSPAPSLSQHRYMYDFDLMRDLLRDTGFKTVERRAYREGRVPDLEILDNRPEETLYVEATK